MTKHITKKGPLPKDAANDAQKSHVLLFSSDLALDAETMIDYYALRFQIEFNFRDAKQYWGLEDFMNVKKTPVNNAANLSMFMVNVSAKLLAPLRLEHAELRVLDFKARYRGKPQYLRETLEILPQKPKPIVIDPIAKLSGQSVLFIIHPLNSIHHKLAKVLVKFSLFKSVSDDEIPDVHPPLKSFTSHREATSYFSVFKSLHFVVSLPLADTSPLIRTVANCLRTPACEMSSIR